MEVNGAPEQPGYKLSSKYLHLGLAKQRHSYRTGTNWGWVNDDRISIFGWTIPWSLVMHFSGCFSFSQALNKSIKMEICFLYSHFTNLQTFTGIPSIINNSVAWGLTANDIQSKTFPSTATNSHACINWLPKHIIFLFLSLFWCILIFAYKINSSNMSSESAECMDNESHACSSRCIIMSNIRRAYDPVRGDSFPQRFSSLWHLPCGQATAQLC